ncbi:sirohydrochlorin cobaltochelatase [Lutispora thermophila]|uniref:Sirohydrochlorin cobaltochelatase n=1 Tax=Lutispora thermophila DSM 19022 TaxID=1122184 RepID=A0A1M6H9S0_9FIRM|nr:sirohydrochlorin cobaltochelatase [Lutispora thermophila]SHJ18873.1 sirohydrochlorin cobaltochelatase [Lutispora thermophila DSM 19022]
MKNKAILVVSFGTSYEETRQKNIVSLELDIAKRFSKYRIYSAYTSSIVRKILMKRNIQMDDVPTAMGKMAKDGIWEVIVQPTHLLYGIEYEKLKNQIIDASQKFKKVKLGRPLLSDIYSLKKVISIISHEIKPEKGTAILLMGHGTSHFSNIVYPALDYISKAEGYDHIFIGTVEGYPDLQIVISQIKKSGFKKVLLTPLMLVAGEHAVNDMASDEDDSWKTVLQKQGLQVTCMIKGLGEYQGIRDIYFSHISEAIDKD